MFYGFDSMMFTIVPLFIMVGFAAIVGIFIMTFVRAARQNRADDASPVLTVGARMVTKRADIRHSTAHTAGNSNLNHIHTYRRHYATFQVESGDRMELEVQESVFGLLAEGDQGRLTFQGKRFLGFEREK